MPMTNGDCVPHVVVPSNNDMRQRFALGRFLGQDAAKALQRNDLTVRMQAALNDKNEFEIVEYQMPDFGIICNT